MQRVTNFLLFQRRAHVSRMEENKSVPVEKSEAEVILLPLYLKYSIKLLLLKPILLKAREADEKEDTVAMPPPQVFSSEIKVE